DLNWPLLVPTAAIVDNGGNACQSSSVLHCAPDPTQDAGVGSGDAGLGPEDAGMGPDDAGLGPEDAGVGVKDAVPMSTSVDGGSIDADDRTGRSEDGAASSRDGMLGDAPALGMKGAGASCTIGGTSPASIPRSLFFLVLIGIACRPRRSSNPTKG